MSNNKKGFTVIEMLISITVIIPLVFGMIIVPTYLMKDYKDYDKLAQYTSEMNIVKRTLASDLESTIVKEVSSENLEIGNVTYSFKDDGLYRSIRGKSSKLSEQSLLYKLEELDSKKLLIIYNDNTNLEFSVGNSSFDLREWGNYGKR